MVCCLVAAGLIAGIAIGGAIEKVDCEDVFGKTTENYNECIVRVNKGGKVFRDLDGNLLNLRVE